MNPIKYRVLIDYNTEGLKFWDEEGYETIDEAVKKAQTCGYGNEFYIVQVIDWEAKEAGLKK